MSYFKFPFILPFCPYLCIFQIVLNFPELFWQKMEKLSNFTLDKEVLLNQYIESHS